ncbi:MAG: WD40 repeat domain-containing protein, partial [Thermoguttaceae bacterium]
MPAKGFFGVLSACVLAAASAIAAESAEPADDAPAPFVQRWGLDAAGGPVDYHAGTNRLLTSHGATAVLWDTATGLALDAMDIGGRALAVAFSDDGRRVLTDSGDGPLRVWDVPTGEKIAQFDPPPSDVMAAAFSPDGRRVAAGCYDHTVWVGEVDADGALGVCPKRGTGTLHPESAAGDTHDVREPVPDFGQTLRELPAGHRGHVISLRFSPDSTRLLSGSYDRQAILWDVEAGRLERIFPTPVETRWSAFRADGRRLLTVGSGTEQGRGRVIEWHIPTRQPVRVLRETVRAAWFVGNDVVVSADNELRLYRQPEQDAGQPTVATVLAPPLPAGRGDRLLLAPGGWQMWIPAMGDKPAADDVPSDRPASGILRSPAGETVPLPLPLRGADSMEFVDISPDGTRLLTACRSRLPHRDPPRLVLWDLTIPEPVHTFPGTMARFHPDGRRVLVGSGRSLQLRRIADGKPLQTYEIDRGGLESARFVAGGRQLLTASGDWYDGNQGQVLLWDVESGEVLRSFFPGDTAVYHAVMDRDEKRLLATFTFGERGVIDRLGIFDAESAERLHVVSPDDYATWWLRAHRQSNRFAAGDERRTTIWSLTDSRLVHQFPGAPGPWSADGRVLATFLKRPPTTLLWDAHDGRYLGCVDTEIVGFHPGGALAFTQDHRTALGVLTAQGGLSRFSRRSRCPSWITPCSPRKWDCPLRPAAELFTFGDDQWLAVTADGHVAGSDEALQRVTWRTRHPADGPRVEVDAKRTARQRRPRKVAEVLTRSLPEGENGTGPICAQHPPGRSG